MSLATVTSAVNDIVTSAAILAGGVWAYFKFIRGRTFAHRAVLDVTASLDNSNDCTYLSVAITFKNTGLSRLPLNPAMKIVRLFRMGDKQDGAVSVAEWERISTTSILDQHDWLEAQETVVDKLVYCLSGSSRKDSSQAVYQVEALVAAPRRLITRKGTEWQSRAVVFPPPHNLAKRNNVGQLMRKIAARGKGNRHE